LDQALTYSENSNITNAVILESLGVPSEVEIIQIFKGIIEGDFNLVRSVCTDFFQKNVSVKNLGKNLLEVLFEAIEQIDQLSSLKKFAQLNKEAVKELSLAEMIW